MIDNSLIDPSGRIKPIGLGGTIGISGSIGAIILGVNDYKTPLKLAREMLGYDEPFKGNRFTEAGKRLEDVIARWYADDTGNKIARANNTFRLKEYPWIMAHIDRRILNQRKVLECKSADKWTGDSWGESGSQEVPDAYFIQVQHYLMFPNWDSADMATLIGGNDFRIYPDIDPDTELQDMMIQSYIPFWDTLQRGDLPDPVNTDDARLLWPNDYVESVFATEDVIEWHHELKRAQTAKKEIEAKIEDLKTKIMAHMQYASILYDENGTKLHTWKTQKSKGFMVSEFEQKHPDIYSKCIVPKFDENLLRKQFPSVYKQYQPSTRVFR